MQAVSVEAGYRWWHAVLGLITFLQYLLFQAYLPICDIGQNKDSNAEGIIFEKENAGDLKDYEERLRKKCIEIKQIEDKFKFQLQQEKFHIAELQTGISQVSVG